jgi:hypothetical protein
MERELSALVRRDHEDLDRGLAAMVDPTCSPNELANLLEVFRLALAVHTAAETKVFDSLLEIEGSPRTLSMIASHARDEHMRQRSVTEGLMRLRPGSLGWYEQALELRVEMLDHSGRAEQLRWTLQEHLSSAHQRKLAGEYATERMRVLASTSPHRLADHRMALARFS